MAITITLEDGTGVTGANVYATKEYVNTFCDNMGLDEWCNNTNLQDAAMTNAAMFIDLRYGSMFCGEKLVDTQGLLFPRRQPDGTSTGIPDALKRAFAFAAYLYIKNGNLALDANAEGGRVVSSESISLGGGAISESKTYATVPANKQISKNVYAFVDGFMRQIPCARMNRSMFAMNVRG